MTVNELNSKLNDALINYLNKLGHNNTGTLEDSIDFEAGVASGILTDINFNAMDYIQYLDDGEFLDNFFSTNEVRDILTEWYQTNLF